MTTPGTRRWFQFHLATAVVVVMIVAGILVAMELRLERKQSGDIGWSTVTESRGFPLPCWSHGVMTGEIVREGVRSWTDYNSTYFLLDALFVVAVLVAVTFFSESVVRRSGARARGPAA